MLSFNLIQDKDKDTQTDTLQPPVKMDCGQNLPPPRFLSISQILILPIPRISPPCFRSIPGSWSLVFWILMGWVTSGHLVCSEHCQKIAAVTKLQKRLPHAIQRISKLWDYSLITLNLPFCWGWTLICVIETPDAQSIALDGRLWTLSGCLTKHPTDGSLVLENIAKMSLSNVASQFCARIIF